ncbi:Ubiquitin carboxyl-terminal hydrolase CYLD [Hypsibius exemplaris]|uniref:ubiquitinyl hydrolase 1 n=1 Tax=Hypsibius exemplaris TaxID=2072580 RepID=A0A1W0X128_HYPEX|nr:Ubiquitin carboxyl-terminal hydrolase CYLD [Hypsibius exemplaris]
MASDYVQSPAPLLRKFILLNKQFGRALVHDAMDARVMVYKGELLEEIFDNVDGGSGHVLVTLISLDRKDIIVECDPRDLQEIGSYGVSLLRSVGDYEKRVELLKKNRLEDAYDFDEGADVTVLLGDMLFPGVIRYRGTLQGRGSGIFFGVELPDHPGHGQCDGSFHGEYYFRCAPLSGAFVAIDRLYARHPGSRPRSQPNDEMDYSATNDLLRRGLTVNPSAPPSNRTYEQSVNQATNRDGNRPSFDQPVNHNRGSDPDRQNGQSGYPAKAQEYDRRDVPPLPVRSDSRQMYPSLPTERSEPTSRSGFISAVEHEIKKSVSALAASTAGIGTQLLHSVRGQQSGTVTTPTDNYKPVAVAASILVKLPVNIGESVFVRSTNGNGNRQLARVRWIGRVSQFDERWLVLNLSIGKGSGLLNGEQLFVTRPNYAAFYPIESLMKIEDEANSVARHSNGTASFPPIDQLDRKPSYSEVTAKKAHSPGMGSLGDQQRPPQTQALSRAPAVRTQPALAIRFPSQEKQQPQPRPRSPNPTVTPSLSYQQLPKMPSSPTKHSEKVTKHSKIEESVTKTKISKKPATPSPDMSAADNRKLNGVAGFDSRGPFQNDSSRNGPTEPPDTYKPVSAAGVSSYGSSSGSAKTFITDALAIHSDGATVRATPLVPARSVDLPTYSNRMVVPSDRPSYQRDTSPAFRNEVSFTRSPPLVQQQHGVPSGGARLRCIDPLTQFGRGRGIQGHKNSCYMDATLFGMFAFSNVFDDILFRKRRKFDGEGFEEVQAILQEVIMKPLRNTLYVSAEDVMRLRECLANGSDVSGLTDQEKDPEEFLTSLLEHIIVIDPLLKMTTTEANWYTLFVEKNLDIKLPTIQELFDLSLVTSDVRLKEAPKCLILQTPRSGAQYKMYNNILPSPFLDITDAILGQPRTCCNCENLAVLECKECYGWMKDVLGLTSTAFCRDCFLNNHKRVDRQKHRPVDLAVIDSDRKPERVIMELFAVICIKTSHYVTFAKDGDGMWYFVDSMADRVGGDSGFNIPEMTPCPMVAAYLDPELGRKRLLERQEANIPLEEPIRRFFEDCYLCMYQPKSNCTDSRLGIPQWVNTPCDL